MSFSIHWNEDAKETFDQVAGYLEDRWGDKQAKKFVTQVISVLTAISDRPYMFALRAENVRKELITNFSNQRQCLTRNRPCKGLWISCNPSNP